MGTFLVEMLQARLMKLCLVFEPVWLLLRCASYIGLID